MAPEARRADTTGESVRTAKGRPCAMLRSLAGQRKLGSTFSRGSSVLSGANLAGWLMLVSCTAQGCRPSAQTLRGQPDSQPATSSSAFLGAQARSHSAHAPTVIGVSNTVVTSRVRHFGMNLGHDNFWDSVLTKNRIKNGGFEGVRYRQIARGPGGDAQSFYDWHDYTFYHRSDDNQLSNRTWLDVFRGAKAWVLAGDRRWSPETILRVEHAKFPGRPQEPERLRFVLSHRGPVVGASGGQSLGEVGMLIEKVDDTVGYVGQHGDPLWAFASARATITTASRDLPPNSTGKVVAVLAAPGSETARLVYPLAPNGLTDPNGMWRVSFWAKGDGRLSYGAGGWDPPAKPVPIAATGDWRRFEGVPLVVDRYTPGALNLHLSVTGGTVKLDDVVAYKEGDRNPTAFRDDVVSALKKLQPGSLRYLFEGGDSVDDALKPVQERMAFSFQRNLVPPTGGIPWPSHPKTNGQAAFLDIGLAEFLGLCEEIRAAPWYCVSGTIFPEEIEHLMEYLAGPSTSPYGLIRAKLGHPRPWTEAFDAIYIEIGNEAWNWGPPWAYGGWNGPEYWRTLFERARRVLDRYPGAKRKVRFQIGAQNYNVWLGAQLVERHGAAADGYAIAPYVIHGMTDAQARLDDTELLSWAYGEMWHADTGGPMQAVRDMIAKSASPQLEVTVYEVNHHVTGGPAPAEPRNRIVTSIGGALNVIAHMLLMLERYQVRTQNFFNLFQQKHGGVGLWGSVLSARPGQERYRPTFLALELANQVLDGDLVKVATAGENRTFHVALQHEQEKLNVDVPYVLAFATRSADARGLIVINLHPTDQIPVRLELPVPVANGTATMWRMTGTHATANNELGHAPEVLVEQSSVHDFAPGYQHQLAPHSMTVWKWRE
jgi:alpha-L-arabinofuranosidase